MSNSPDRRRQQAGHRKAGYCGHVPDTIYFERHERVEVSIHPGKTNVERRVPSTTVSSRSPVEMGCIGGDIEVQHNDMSVLAKLARRPQPKGGAEATTAAASNVGGSAAARQHEPISGYSGHRSGQFLHCGGKQGETKIVERDREQQNVPKFDSLPRMPLIRGPHRRQPTGFDVFLTI